MRGGASGGLGGCRWGPRLGGSLALRVWIALFGAVGLTFVSAGDLAKSEALRMESKALVERMGEVGSSGAKRELGLEALKLARESVAADDSNSEAHLSVAITVGKLSFLKSARERIKDAGEIRDEAERAIELDAGNSLAWFVLGRWNYELANLGGGTKFFAETFFGKMPDASNERAVECLERAVALDGDRAMYRAELGRAYLAVGDDAKAEKELAAALDLKPVDQEERDSQERARKALSGL